MHYDATRAHRRAGRAGFTLIELLTVIAIMAILAAITITAVTQYLDRAKEVQTEANMRSVSQSLTQYYARTDNIVGFPPAYGYIDPASADGDETLFTDANHVLRPYTQVLGIHDADDLFQLDAYTLSYDMNNDGALSFFEFLPVGQLDPGSGNYIFSDFLYLYSAAAANQMPVSGTVNEVSKQMSGTIRRPFVYIPYNTRQLQAATRYWYAIGEEAVEAGGGAASFDTASSELSGRMFFPPPQYDAFVLIGNGPGGNDGGLCSIPVPGTPGTDYDNDYAQHVLALRIAFLATRDRSPDGGITEPDGLLDHSYPDRDRADGNQVHLLPDGTNGLGPYILVGP